MLRNPRLCKDQGKCDNFQKDWPHRGRYKTPLFLAMLMVTRPELVSKSSHDCTITKILLMEAEHRFIRSN